MRPCPPHVGHVSAVLAATAVAVGAHLAAGALALGRGLVTLGHAFAIGTFHAALLPVVAHGHAGREAAMGAAATFDSLVGDLDYPMFIVTATAGDDRAGCLIGFATQTSIDPQRFLVCLSRRNRTYRVARRTDLLGVHFVPSEAADLAELFGGATGDEVDKFAAAKRIEPGHEA